MTTLVLTTAQLGFGLILAMVVLAAVGTVMVLQERRRDRAARADAAAWAARSAGQDAGITSMNARGRSANR